MSIRDVRARAVDFDVVEGVRDHGETGSSLVLALVFLIAVSMMVTAVTGWTGTSLADTAKFSSAQSNQTTANSANAIAVQFARYNFLSSTLNASPPVACWPNGKSQTQLPFGGSNVMVNSFCSTYWTTGTQGARVVTISTCVGAVAATCAASPLVQTVVSFGDTDPTTGFSSCLPVTTPVTSGSTTCGISSTVLNWAFGATPPSVSVAVDAAPTISCGSNSSPVTITISGTPYVALEPVYFVISSSNQAIPVSTMKINSSSSLEACTPVAGKSLGASNIVVLTSTGPNLFSSTTAYTL